MKIIKFFFLLYLILSTDHLFADNHDFNKWLISFKAHALKQEISEITIDTVMKNVKFLPKVIKYDRYQPEFYEDTKTYINKRTSKKKIDAGLELFFLNKPFFSHCFK